MIYVDPSLARYTCVVEEIRNKKGKITAIGLCFQSKSDGNFERKYLDTENAMKLRNDLIFHFTDDTNKGE